jgi:hypothetical protein
MNRLPCNSLRFIKTFLLKDFWFSHGRVLHGSSLSESLRFCFWRSNIALLARNIDKFCYAKLQFLRGVSVVCGDSRLFSLCVSSNWRCVIELLARFVPTVNSMFNSFNHLLISTAVLIVFRLWGLSWNWSTLIFFRFSELILILACIGSKNVVWQPGFWPSVHRRQRCSELSLGLNFVFDRWYFYGCHLDLVSGLLFTRRNYSATVDTLLWSCRFLCLRNQSNSCDISRPERVIQYVDWMIYCWVIQTTCTCLAYDWYSVSFVLWLKVLKTLSSVHRFEGWIFRY